MPRKTTPTTKRHKAPKFRLTDAEYATCRVFVERIVFASLRRSRVAESFKAAASAVPFDTVAYGRQCDKIDRAELEICRAGAALDKALRTARVPS